MAGMTVRATNSPTWGRTVLRARTARNAPRRAIVVRTAAATAGRPKPAISAWAPSRAAVASWLTKATRGSEVVRRTAEAAVLGVDGEAAADRAAARAAGTCSAGVARRAARNRAAATTTRS